MLSFLLPLTVDFLGLHTNACLTCSTCSSATYGLPVLFLLHMHPVSWNCAYRLRMELSDGGCLPNLVRNCRWTIVTDRHSWNVNTQNAFSLPFAAILVNCAPSGEMHNYCTPHIIKENCEFLNPSVQQHTAISSVLCMTSCYNPDNHSNNPAFSREILEHATTTKFHLFLSRIFENEACKHTDVYHSLTQQIVPGVDDITTSAYWNVVAEVEVEQSSSCHVRDVCAAEGSTLVIGNDATLQSGSYNGVTFRHTCHSQWNQPSISGRPAPLNPGMAWQASQNSYESALLWYEIHVQWLCNTLDIAQPLFACHVRPRDTLEPDTPTS